MTRQQFISLSDLIWKIGTPISLTLFAWTANRVVDKIDKLEDGFSSVRVVMERHETKIISVEELVKSHIQMNVR